MAGDNTGEMSTNTNRRKYNSPYSVTYDVFVGNLPENATEKSVTPLFVQFGEMKAVTLHEGKRNDGTKIAYIKYYSEPDADTAVKERSGHLWDGVPLTVRRCEKKQQGDSRSNGLGSGDGANTYGAGKRKFDNDGGGGGFKGSSSIIQPQKETLLMTHVEDPCTFYAQRVVLADETQDLCLKLAEACPSSAVIDGKPVKGQKYGTMYSEDGQWYRCQVLQYITEEKTLVKYIDWGNAEIVENNKIVVLPDDLARIPEFAKRYRLNNVNPPRKDAVEADVFQQGIKHLNDLLSTKTLDCQAFPNNKLDFVPVSIVLNDVNLEEDVILRGYALKHQRPNNNNFSKEGVVSPSTGYQASAMDLAKKSPANSNQRSGKQPAPVRGSSNDMICSARAVLGSQPSTGSNQAGNFKSPPVGQWTGGNPGESRVQGLVQDRDTALKEAKSLRQQCNQYQQRIEQLTAQAAKNNFNTKVNHIVEQLREVKMLRVQFPTSADDPDLIEYAAKLLLDDPARVLPQNLLHLPSVKQAMNTYQSSQKGIAECKDKDELPNLIIPRDEARRAFHTALVAFLKEMQSLPLQERFQKLEEVVNSLNKTFSNFFKVKANGSLPLNSLMDAFKDWKDQNYVKFAQSRQETDKCHADYEAGIRQLNEALSLKPSYVSSPPNLIPVLDRLTAALCNEYRTCNVEDSSGLAVVAMVIQKLGVELTQERDYVQQLKALQEEYTATEAEIRPWLSSSPDIGPLNAIRKKIKGLKSRLRHKLADQHDLEEENEVDHSALTKVKCELSVIRNDLQAAFAEEDKTMAELAVLVKTHYPELAVLQPDLVTEVEHHGLVKQGRDIDQFDVEELQCPSTDKTLMKSTVGGNSVMLKEYVFDGVASKATFVKRIEEYSNIKSEQLVPLNLVFFSKGERQAYVQIPFYCYNLLERLEDGVLSQEAQQIILTDIVNGVHSLHSNGIVHGALHPHNILVTDEGRALISPYNFCATPAQRVESCSEQCNNGLTFTAPELAFSVNDPSSSTDMYAIGALVLLMQLPSTIFTMQPSRIPDIKAVMPFPLSDLVEQLICAPATQRPSAETLLQSLQLLSPLSLSTTCYTQQNNENVAFRDESTLGDRLEINRSLTWQASNPLLQEVEGLREPLEEEASSTFDNGYDDLYGQYNIGENYASSDNYTNVIADEKSGIPNVDESKIPNSDSQYYSPTCHV